MNGLQCPGIKLAKTVLILCTRKMSCVLRRKTFILIDILRRRTSLWHRPYEVNNKLQQNLTVKFKNIKLTNHNKVALHYRKASFK